jgi:putative oxidoreductase
MMSSVDIKQESRQSVVGENTGKGRNIALWVLQVLAAGAFVMAGGSKLSGVPQMVALFDAIGIGQWFRYLTGSIEVISAILLLVPGLSGIGALLLAGTMVGAIATHIFIVGGTFVPPLVLLVITAIIVWGRKEQVLGLISRFTGK